MAVEKRVLLARPHAFIGTEMRLPAASPDAALKALRVHLG